MEAKELRIGNYVMSKHGIITQIERGDFEYHSGLANLEDNLPIPLTDEWLRNFNFFGVSNESGTLTNFFYRELRVRWTESYGYMVGYYDLKFSHCKYIHQLQNLFYSLTGEELTVREFA